MYQTIMNHFFLSLSHHYKLTILYGMARGEIRNLQPWTFKKGQCNAPQKKSPVGNRDRSVQNGIQLIPAQFAGTSSVVQPGTSSVVQPGRQ
jgi:hypothetical protein